MASLVLTIRETLRYRGAIGQWSWVLHRITGLGVLLFLFLHVVDTSWAAFWPGLYEHAIQIYQSPLFTLGEFALTACVVYHAFNGLRIVVFDFRPDLWRYQERAAYAVLGATGLVLVPLFIGMGLHAINHYQKPDVTPLPLDEVLISQFPFVVGAAAAIIAALILSAIYGILMGEEKTPVSARHTGSLMEGFWWSFMRISGVLIIPLVFGHLAMVHVLQGVFDITAANFPVVGTTALNDSGTAVEFVAERWNFAIAGVAIWRIYDIVLLALVVVHGFNGLRYVITDYTMASPFLRRAAVIVCTLVAAVLLAVGGLALLTTIEPEAIEQARHALRAISMAR